jgi:L-threonylcarbamoyladenylate synthase
MGARAELVPDLIAAITHPVTKVLAVGEPPVPVDTAPVAREHFAGRADVTISHPRYLEFIAPGVSKGRAVRWLARRLHIPLAQTLAIGDQWNDLEMLAEVGHGVAMPQAPAGVRAAARYVAPPLEEEGAAQIIEQLVLANSSAVAATSRRTGGGGGGARPAVGVTARIVPDDAGGRAIAVQILRDGGIVALPTDTVYGIAVALVTPGGIDRLFQVKRRLPDKAVMLLLDDAAQAADAGRITPAAAALIAACWPGGLTVVVPQLPDVRWPAMLTGGVATIGLRVPDHDAPRALARAVGPLPTTSANVSGIPEATDAAGIVAQLGDAIDLVLDGGPAHGGPASTIVDCSGEEPTILRAGAVPAAAVAEILAAAGIRLAVD